MGERRVRVITRPSGAKNFVQKKKRPETFYCQSFIMIILMSSLLMHTTYMQLNARAYNARDIEVF